MEQTKTCSNGTAGLFPARSGLIHLFQVEILVILTNTFIFYLHYYLDHFTPSQSQLTVLSGSFFQYIYCHLTSPNCKVLKGNKSSCALEQKMVTVGHSWKHFQPFSSRVLRKEISDTTYEQAAVFIICYACMVNQTHQCVFISFGVLLQLY